MQDITPQSPWKCPATLVWVCIQCSSQCPLIRAVQETLVMLLWLLTCPRLLARGKEALCYLLWGVPATTADCCSWFPGCYLFSHPVCTTCAPAPTQALVSVNPTGGSNPLLLHLQSLQEDLFFLPVVSQVFQLCYFLGSRIPRWEVGGFCSAGVQVSNGSEIGGIIVSGETVKSVPARQHAWAAQMGSGSGRGTSGQSWVCMLHTVQQTFHTTSNMPETLAPPHTCTAPLCDPT